MTSIAFINITIILAIVLLCYIFFKRLVIKNNKKLQDALELSEKTKAEIADLSELVEQQKNLILSQRSEINTQNIGIDRLKAKNDTVISQKKSSEVRLGQISEQLLPFTNGYMYDHKSFHFLGWPCDGLQIEEDAIIFIEFKSGKAKLSASQRKVRDLVGKGKVRFETFRVDETGIHLKLESSMEDIQ